MFFSISCHVFRDQVQSFNVFSLHVFIENDISPLGFCVAMGTFLFFIAIILVFCDAGSLCDTTACSAPLSRVGLSVCSRDKLCVIPLVH